MNIALILAGGLGSRLGGGIPKQYIEVGGRPVISYCLETFQRHEEIDGIQVVAEEEWHGLIRNQLHHKFKGFSSPGENRQLSILNGLEDILQYADKKDIVMIHDAARPMVGAGQISVCLRAAGRHEGGVPVLPMKDTVYVSRDGSRIASLLDRSTVFAGQAPESFVLDRYYEANKRLLPEQILKINGSAEPAVMAGMDIALVPGDEANFKITTREDLLRFQQIIERGQTVHFDLTRDEISRF